MHKSFDSRVDVSRNAGAMFTVTPGDTGPIFVIWTRKKRDIPPLAHELLHAVNSVLHHAGVKPDFEDDESQAYLLTWVMEKALESIK